MIQVRTALASDASIIVNYNVALASESENLALSADVVRRGVDAALSDPSKGVYFLAVDDHLVVGQILVTYEWSDWRNGYFWWMQSVYVAPAYRSQGVFKMIFNHLRNMAERDPAVRGLRLYVDQHNAKASSVYDRLGFEAGHYQVREQLVKR